MSERGPVCASCISIRDQNGQPFCQLFDAIRSGHRTPPKDCPTLIDSKDHTETNMVYGEIHALGQNGTDIKTHGFRKTRFATLEEINMAGRIADWQRGHEDEHGVIQSYVRRSMTYRNEMKALIQALEIPLENKRYVFELAAGIRRSRRRRAK